jgi:molybdenum cofactor guanylyltransferase
MTTASTSNLTAIILAGGKSSRMGQDKALIEIHGIPMIQKVYQVAATCCQQVIVVTPWQEHYQKLLPHTCKFIPEVHTQNHAPLLGFAQALTVIETKWVLLLACDLPNLDVETIKVWSSQLNQIEANYTAALVKHVKGWEPLCGFYHQACFPSLQAFIHQGGRSFQKWLAQIPVATLPNSNPEIFDNCNTPADVIRINNQNK